VQGSSNDVEPAKFVDLSFHYFLLVSHVNFDSSITDHSDDPALPYLACQLLHVIKCRNLVVAIGAGFGR
jgi:hypothetical protein